MTDDDETTDRLLRHLEHIERTVEEWRARQTGFRRRTVELYELADARHAAGDWHGERQARADYARAMIEWLQAGVALSSGFARSSDEADPGPGSESGRRREANRRETMLSAIALLRRHVKQVEALQEGQPIPAWSKPPVV